MNQIGLEGSSAPFELDLGIEPVMNHRRRLTSASDSRTGTWIRARLVESSGVIALLVLWEVGPRLHWIDSQFFPPLSAILAEGWTLLSTGALFLHIFASLLRTVTGLAMAIATAIPLGILLGGFLPRLARFFRSLFTLLGQVNAFSLFPLFVLFFGIGELAKFGIIYWSCFWPLFFGTLAGVRAVDPLLLKTARSMSCDRRTLLADVLLPASLPTILTGVRIGATVAFLMLIAAEMVGAQTGLGWLVHNSQVNYIIPRLYLAAAVIAFLGMLIEYSLRRAEARLVHWKADPVTA